METGISVISFLVILISLAAAVTTAPCPRLVRPAPRPEGHAVLGGEAEPRVTPRQDVAVPIPPLAPRRAPPATEGAVAIAEAVAASSVQIPETEVIVVRIVGLLAVELAEGVPAPTRRAPRPPLTETAGEPRGSLVSVGVNVVVGLPPGGRPRTRVLCVSGTGAAVDGHAVATATLAIPPRPRRLGADTAPFWRPPLL